jgi:hypothetical protein
LTKKPKICNTPAGPVAYILKKREGPPYIGTVKDVYLSGDRYIGLVEKAVDRSPRYWLARDVKGNKIMPGAGTMTQELAVAYLILWHLLDRWIQLGEEQGLC